MPTFNSQIIYNWAGDMKGVPYQLEEQEHKLPSVDDIVGAFKNAETAMSQKIIQDNAESSRLQTVISESGLGQLSGGASLADVIAAVNRINTFLSTQLVDSGSNE